MTDSTHVGRQVAGLARVRDEELEGVESSVAARKLLASLMTTGQDQDVVVPHRRHAGWQVSRLVAAAAAVIALTVAGVLASSVLGGDTGGATSYANSAIDVTLENGFFVGRIKDPVADHAKYAEAFHAVGKDVSIELVPVSPRLVGQLLESSIDGRGRVSTNLAGSAANSGNCGLESVSCTMEVRVSADASGPVRFRIGRTARPGEAYQDFVTPGEPR